MNDEPDISAGPEAPATEPAAVAADPALRRYLWIARGTIAAFFLVDLWLMRQARLMVFNLRRIASLAPEDPTVWMRTALIVALSYLAGSMAPLLPVVCGAASVLASILAALAMVMFVSVLLAFLSGMDVKRRLLTNVTMIFGAAAFAYAIGRPARDIGGIQV